MNKCFECEATEDLQEHHVVPKSKGGTKTVTLCYECHMKAHGRSGKGLNHKNLTKEGLAKAKARGVKLGTHAQSPDGRKIVLEALRAKGQKSYEAIAPYVRQAIADGCNSNRTIATWLNEHGITTSKGKTFQQGQVSRIRKRMREEAKRKMEEL